MKKRFMVVSYYTRGTPYESHARKLRQSCQRYEIPHLIRGVHNQGNWWANTQYKPTWVLKLFEEGLDAETEYICLLDCDAEFLAYPTLFDTLECDIAAHEFDRRWRWWQPGEEGPMEFLAGTLFLPTTPNTVQLMWLWARECKKHPRLGNQKPLASIVGDDYTRLPPEYCALFDAKVPKHPIILHWQASRQFRGPDRLVESTDDDPLDLDG